jgi:hypothetical protein
VLAAIFSVLAIAFLLEIDDRPMEAFQTMGWTESAFYTAKLRPRIGGRAPPTKWRHWRGGPGPRPSPRCGIARLAGGPGA